MDSRCIALNLAAAIVISVSFASVLCSTMSVCTPGTRAGPTREESDDGVDVDGIERTG